MYGIKILIHNYVTKTDYMYRILGDRSYKHKKVSMYHFLEKVTSLICLLYFEIKVDNTKYQ